MAQGQSRQGDARHRRRRLRASTSAASISRRSPAPASSSCRIAPARPTIMRDLVAGHIDLTIDQAITALPYIRNGQVQGLRGHRQQAARLRARYPDRGRGRCAGRLHLDLVRHVGAEGHADGGDREVHGGAAMDALADPAVRERLADLGQEIPPPEQQTAAGARRASEGRDREMVAADQGSEHQGRVRSMDLIIRNARLSDRPADEPLDIGIDEGRIVAIERAIAADAQVYDAKGCLACPGPDRDPHPSRQVAHHRPLRAAGAQRASAR